MFLQYFVQCGLVETLYYPLIVIISLFKNIYNDFFPTTRRLKYSVVRSGPSPLLDSSIYLYIEYLTPLYWSNFYEFTRIASPARIYFYENDRTFFYPYESVRSRLVTFPPFGIARKHTFLRLTTSPTLLQVKRERDRTFRVANPPLPRPFNMQYPYRRAARRLRIYAEQKKKEEKNLNCHCCRLVLLHGWRFSFVSHWPGFIGRTSTGTFYFRVQRNPRVTKLSGCEQQLRR